MVLTPKIYNIVEIWERHILARNDAFVPFLVQIGRAL